jgi:hypothetical protein
MSGDYVDFFRQWAGAQITGGLMVMWGIKALDKGVDNGRTKVPQAF